MVGLEDSSPVFRSHLCFLIYPVGINYIKLLPWTDPPSGRPFTTTNWKFSASRQNKLSLVYVASFQCLVTTVRIT